MVEKIKTGIPGLDDMMDGGLPKGSTTVISGPPGIGKSNLAMQYIYNGVSKYDDPGVYITVEDTVEDMENYAAGFGWNVREYEDAGKIAVLGREIFEGTDMDLGMDFGILRDVIKETQASRIVFHILYGILYRY
ncbi:MAG: circadian regulator CirA, partial [Candidatus Altiarchaeota archaeon]|nr:circadian regulator CirA [Candidatus Altiarchaeota archaeon]